MLAVMMSFGQLIFAADSIVSPAAGFDITCASNVYDASVYSSGGGTFRLVFEYNAAASGSPPVWSEIGSKIETVAINGTKTFAVSLGTTISAGSVKSGRVLLYKMTTSPPPTFNLVPNEFKSGTFRGPAPPPSHP